MEDPDLLLLPVPALMEDRDYDYTPEDIAPYTNVFSEHIL